jgi:hypothetical protein
MPSAKQLDKKPQKGIRPRGPYGLSVPEAGAMIGLGRSASYEAAKKGEIPTLEMGSLKIVPRLPWLKQIGASPEADKA